MRLSTSPITRFSPVALFARTMKVGLKGMVFPSGPITVMGRGESMSLEKKAFVDPKVASHPVEVILISSTGASMAAEIVAAFKRDGGGLVKPAASISASEARTGRGMMAGWPKEMFVVGPSDGMVSSVTGKTGAG